MQYTTPSPSQAPMTREQMLSDFRSKALRGAQDQTALTGLDEKYNRYTAQRDRAIPVPETGRLGWGAALSNIVGSGMAKNELDTIEPQRAAAMGRVNAAKTALPLYNASVANADASQQQSNFDSTAADKMAAANALAQTKAAREAKMDARYDEEQAQTATAPTEYVNGSGAKVLLSRRQDGKWIDGKGDVMDSIEGLSEVPKATVTTDGSSYKDKSANARAEESINNLAAGDRIVGLYNDLSPATLERIGSLKERLIKNAASYFPKDLATIIKAERESDPQVKQYFSALANTSAIERHALFGGALTEYEGKSAEDFISFVVGLRPEEQISRIRNSVAKNRDALRSGDVIHGNGSTNYMNAYNAMGFSNLSGLSESTPQEGSVNANRNATPAYDDKEEAAYQAWKLSQEAQ
jgi:hypothetical protein